MRLLLSLAVAVPGWVLALSYIYIEKREYSHGIFEHLSTTSPLYLIVFNLLLLMSPLVSTFLGVIIYERDRLLGQMGELEQKYRDYYENAPNGYHSADASMVIVDVNEMWLKMLGYNQKEILGKKKVTDLMPPSSVEATMKVYPDFVKDGRIENLEIELIKADGTVLPVSLSSTAVYGHDGRFIRSRTIVKDISERKVYEKILSSVAEEWERTFNSMPWGVMLLDGSCRVLRSNDYFVNAGLDPKAIASSKCREITLAFADNSSLEDALMTEHSEEDRHYMLYGKDVSIAGPSSGYVFSVVDITELKRGQKKLVDSRNAFFNMLKDLSDAYKELDALHNGLIYAFANAIDAKSPWTKGHSERVSNYAIALARKVGLKENALMMLRTASLLHDVGKIGTFDYLLDKPEKLTEEEFQVVKMHPEKSASILEPISRFSEIIDVVKYHHEQFDGGGYPSGLKGEDIPYMARILSIADAYDSMTADRPYRQAPGVEYAIEELRKCSGTHFDPALVEIFVEIAKEGEF